MKKTFKVLFYLKRSRIAKQGQLPIYARLTVDSKRVEWNTQRMCSEEMWNSNACRVTGQSKETKAINGWLEQLNSKLYEAQRELAMAGKEITAVSVRNVYNGISDDVPTHKVLEVYQHHNDQFSCLVGKEYSLGTLKKFKTAYKSLHDFIKHQYKANDVPLDKLNHQFITGYEYYLKTEKNIQHNTAMGMIKKLKKIVRQCVANDWLLKDPFLSYKIKLRETHRAYLTEAELEDLLKKKFSIKRLELVKDLFLFSCFTGISYTDLLSLKPADVIIGIDKGLWIDTERTKTGTPCRIPLLPKALEILHRYRDDPRSVNAGLLFPVITNQKVNAYLKEIADCLGIQKELTFHCARHTFATTITLTNGVPIETVSKMLGHKSLRTTQIYAKVLDKKVSDDMASLKLKYAKQTPLKTTLSVKQ